MKTLQTVKQVFLDLNNLPLSTYHRTKPGTKGVKADSSVPNQLDSNMVDTSAPAAEKIAENPQLENDIADEHDF